MRVVLQALLGDAGHGCTRSCSPCRRCPCPTGRPGVKLGGGVTAEAVLRAVYDGLQLADDARLHRRGQRAGQPRRLLRSFPGALYEIGVAVVVALTFAPQLVDDARRVRAARRLRGAAAPGSRALPATAMPVLEGALERSVDLAAAMDSRGYGRTAHVAAARAG